MIDRETGLWIYNKMNEIRDFEETAWTLFTENKLRGSVHLHRRGGCGSLCLCLS